MSEESVQQNLDLTQDGKYNLRKKLLELGYLEGFDFSYITPPEPPITIDYDAETDEWLVKFRKEKYSSIYSEYQWTMGKILGSKWDKEINGWRFPSTSTTLAEIFTAFETQAKQHEFAAKHNSEYDMIRYHAATNVELSEISKLVAESKRNLEERWTKLQREAEGNSPTEQYHPNIPLMHHQHNGIEFALSHNRCLLADDMGTGKTLQALDVAYHRFTEKQISRALTIVPNTIKMVWKNQANFYYGGKILPIIVRGNFDERLNKLQVFSPSSGAMPLYIISYESARTHPVELQKILDDGMLILDECHKIKSAGAKVTKVVQELIPVAAMLLTGTPIVNYPEDAWSIFNFIKPGLAGRSYDEFFRKFCDYDSYTHRIQYHNLEEFNARVKPFFIRRLKKDVLADLPEKIYVNDFEDIEIEGQQVKLYRDMASTFKAMLQNMQDGVYVSEAVNIVSQIMRLLQICDGYISSGAPSAEWSSDNAKLSVLKEILKEYASNGNGRKIVIWSRFIPPLQMLATELAEYHPVVLHGGVPEMRRGTGPMDDESTVVGKFWHNEDVKILLGQIHTGGLGVDLSCADLCIFYDQWWSPGINQQAEDRLHRKGQKNAVTIIRLVTSKTIEQFYFAQEYEWEGMKQEGLLHKKAGWIAKAIEGEHTLIPTREELIEWLDRI